MKCEKFTDDRQQTPSDGNSSPGPTFGPGELKIEKKKLIKQKKAQFKQKIFKNLETAYSEKIKEYWNILKSMKKKPVENINEEIFLKCFIVRKPFKKSK